MGNNNLKTKILDNKSLQSLKSDLITLPQEQKKDEDFISSLIPAIYCRVSSKEQMNGYSLDEQARLFKEYIKLKGMKNYRIYREEAISGKSLDRPQLQRLLYDIEMGKVNVVVVLKLDRLSRNHLDSLILANTLYSLGVGIISLTQDLDTTTTMGQIILSILSGFGQMELETLSERIKMGLRSRIMQGLWKGGTTQLGYSYNQKTGKLEIDKKEARTVKLIFEKYLKFGTMRTVVNWLNRNNISTRTGARWMDSTLGAIISREVYIIVMKMNGERYNDEDMRIIFDKLFAQAQELRDSRRHFSPKKRKSQRDPYGIYSDRN